MVRRWTRIAVCLLVIGLVMTLPTAYELQPRVAAEGTVIVRWGGLELGPFDGDLHKWSLWIEDAYPDLDEVTLFDIYASRNPGREATYMDVPTEVEVRDFGGVRCQLVHVWWGLRGGGWYFCLRSFGELPGEEEDVLEVFLVRAGGEAVTAVFGAGLAKMWRRIRDTGASFDIDVIFRYYVAAVAIHAAYNTTMVILHLTDVLKF